MKNSVDILNAEVQPPVEHDVEKLSRILIAVAPVAVFQLLRSDNALFFIKNGVSLGWFPAFSTRLQSYTAS